MEERVKDLLWISPGFAAKSSRGEVQRQKAITTKDTKEHEGTRQDFLREP
jgi:hypothetical protein